jgi:hypothetical protein
MLLNISQYLSILRYCNKFNFTINHFLLNSIKFKFIIISRAMYKLTIYYHFHISLTISLGTIIINTNFLFEISFKSNPNHTIVAVKQYSCTTWPHGQRSFVSYILMSVFLNAPWPHEKLNCVMFSSRHWIVAA